MIKITVLDHTAAAIKIGRFIEQELPVTAEIIVDRECCDKAALEKRVAEFVGETDVIVLINPLLSSLMGAYLRRKYPAQKFVFYGQDLPMALKNFPRVMILTDPRLRVSEDYQLQKAMCACQEIRELSYDRWLNLARRPQFACIEETLAEIGGLTGEKLVLNSSELIELEDNLRKIVGWRAEVIDLRQGIVQEIKEYLEMHDNRGRVRFRAKEVLVQNYPLARLD